MVLVWQQQQLLPQCFTLAMTKKSKLMTSRHKLCKEVETSR